MRDIETINQKEDDFKARKEVEFQSINMQKTKVKDEEKSLRN